MLGYKLDVDISGEMLEVTAQSKYFFTETQIDELFFAIHNSMNERNVTYHASAVFSMYRFVITFDVSPFLDSFIDSDDARIYYSEVIYDNLPREFRKALI